MRVYINSVISIPKYYLPFVEKVTFADGVAWEFVDVEKMEFNAYSRALEIYFTVNGKTEEVHLYNVLVEDVFAVYTR